MIYQLVIVERVYQQLNESAIWYEKQQNGLGANFLDEFQSAIKIVHSNPFVYEKKFKQFRQAILKRFPFLIIFEIIKNEIVVHQFINVKRNLVKRYKI